MQLLSTVEANSNSISPSNATSRGSGPGRAPAAERRRDACPGEAARRGKERAPRSWQVRQPPGARREGRRRPRDDLRVVPHERGDRGPARRGAGLPARGRRGASAGRDHRGKPSIRGGRQMQVAELANLLELAKLRIEIDDQRKIIEVLTAENV